MIDFSQCQITLDFQFGSINNHAMDIKVTAGNQTQHVTPTSNICEFNLTLPTQITIQTFGKNMNTDTIVDEHGNIVADKYVKLVGFKIDRIAIPEIYIMKIVKFNNGSDSMTTNYFGFNGIATIDLDCQTVFQQYHRFINAGLA